MQITIAHQVCDSLPSNVTSALSLPGFKNRLKTYLFATAMTLGDFTFWIGLSMSLKTERKA